MDPIEELARSRNLIERVLDLAEEIAKRTETEIDDRTIVVLRAIIERLLS
jgi:hypothetical protein